MSFSEAPLSIPRSYQWIRDELKVKRVISSYFVEILCANCKLQEAQ